MINKCVYSAVIVVALFMILSFMNIFVACTGDDDDDSTPTETPTATPTPTPEGNAPPLLYPVDNVNVTDATLTFDWSDVPGATTYWFVMWVWYPAGESGGWQAIWDLAYQETSESQLIINREDIWFYYNNETNGWQSGEYSWSVTSDMSTAWSQTAYFTWTE